MALPLLWLLLLAFSLLWLSLLAYPLLLALSLLELAFLL
jgi:hypothetical protein